MIRTPLPFLLNWACFLYYNKLGWLPFSFLLVVFLFIKKKKGHYFLIKVNEQIYTNSIFYPPIFLHNQIKKFSIPPFFYPPNKTLIRETKIFFILPLFHPFPNFYPSTFSSSQPNKPLAFGAPTMFNDGADSSVF